MGKGFVPLSFVQRGSPLTLAALRLLPPLVVTIGAAVFISQTIEANPKLKKRLANELEGKVFRFEGWDIKRAFYLFIEKGEAKLLPHAARPPDVTMRGELSTLVSLFLGTTDADTVFFSRKLEIEGDTATAVLLKNILAA
jgi:predicted lipid carrier protein YhbT